MTVIAASNYPFPKHPLDDPDVPSLGHLHLDCHHRADRLFRRHPHSRAGGCKAAWVILVMVLPFLGVLVYLIVYPAWMAERGGNAAAASQAQFDDPCARPPARAVPRAK